MTVDQTAIPELLKRLQKRSMVRPLTFTLDKGDEKRIVGQIPINKYVHNFGTHGCEIIITHVKSGFVRLQARCLSFIIPKDTFLDDEQSLTISNYLHHACTPIQITNGQVITTSFFKYEHVDDSIGFYFTHMLDVLDCELDKVNLLSLIEGLLWVNPYMTQGVAWDALEPLILKDESGTSQINSVHLIY